MKKILIINANYYKDVTTKLFIVARNYLKMNNVKINLIEVPGVFEIPIAVRKNIKKYDGFVAIGCVIKGKTPHFDFISDASINAIMKLSINSKKPIGLGIITCLNIKQALARKKKGAEATKAVLSVLSQV